MIIGSECKTNSSLTDDIQPSSGLFPSKVVFNGDPVEASILLGNFRNLECSCLIQRLHLVAAALMQDEGVLVPHCPGNAEKKQHFGLVYKKKYAQKQSGSCPKKVTSSKLSGVKNLKRNTTGLYCHGKASS
ncbi:hypothetical protein E2C01_028127 [Portunus trituberculatus]|uniref:Uncharacterized protein n=1 Tax=Portunus trituberculatus TaxID=210409 RepID=A0A5B7END5_PORTR|nr:hypothetical protein [Portunus trituberculatus]